MASSCHWQRPAIDHSDFSLRQFTSKLLTFTDNIVLIEGLPIGLFGPSDCPSGIYWRTMNSAMVELTFPQNQSIPDCGKVWRAAENSPLANLFREGRQCFGRALRRESAHFCSLSYQPLSCARPM
jgi:hypothetical protein